MADNVYDFDAVMAAKREQAGEGPRYKLAGQEWQCLAIAPVSPFNYLQELLVPEQREDFGTKVLDSDAYDLDLFAKVVEYLTEQYNGRPTVPASPSA